VSADWAATARLLRRTGFGASGADIDAAQRVGPQRYVSQLLAADPAADPGARITPLPELDLVAPIGANTPTAEIMARNQRISRQLNRLSVWWLQRMAVVQQPFGEKLTLCWHNHFATSAQKVRNATYMRDQNVSLRTLGRGDFRALALDVLTDAAMLMWLDGERNTAAAPNENLSREYMELFTLGQGDGYTEADVREGARALTGWKLPPAGPAYLRAADHDAGIKTVLGVTGNLDDVGFCDAVLAEPGSARYLASRWWRQLVSDTPPPPEVVDRLVAAYGPQRSLTALVTTMLTMPEFAAAQNSIVVSPVEWLLGAVRTLRVPVASEAVATNLLGLLASLGQVPFYPPSVGGWPSGQAWLSSGAAELRLRAAIRLAGVGELSAVSSARQSARLDVVAHLLGIASWSDRSARALAPQLADPVRLVAFALNTPE